MELLRPTPEGRVVLALVDGAKGYAELRRLTGLSDRWLSVKLRQLIEEGVVERVGGRYRLARPEIVYGDEVALAYLRSRASLSFKARAIAEELARDERVLAVVLLGSVARGSSTEESDVDLLVITDGDVELHDRVYELSFRHAVPVEAIFLSLDDFLLHARLRSTLLLGVVEGYRVLHDRVGVAGILSYLRERVDEEFAYNEEAGAWIRRSEPTTRPR